MEYLKRTDELASMTEKPAEEGERLEFLQQIVSGSAFILELQFNLPLFSFSIFAYIHICKFHFFSLHAKKYKRILKYVY